MRQISHRATSALAGMLLAAAALAAPAAGQEVPVVQPDSTQAGVPGITTRVAGDSLLEAKTRAVASQLRCPVCQGLSLQDSPSELSQEMRDLVREQLRSGKSPDEVKQYFVNRYGEWILLDPQAHGFNWVVYALPVLLLVVGGAGLVVAVRRWSARPTPSSDQAPLLEEDEEPSGIA